MTLHILSDAELERRLHTDPDNLQLLLEAARRFPRTAERADEADAAESAHEAAEDEVEELRAEIQTLKDELAQTEARADELQKELDDAPTKEQLVKALKQIDSLKAEIQQLEESKEDTTEALVAAEEEIVRLNTVLELVSDA